MSIMQVLILLAQAVQPPPSSIPYVSEITDFISRFSSIATVIITTFTAVIMNKVKVELAQHRLEMEQYRSKITSDLAEFKMAIMKELAGSFLPKPQNDGDWPLTRREIISYLEGAKEHRMKLEAEIRELKSKAIQ